MTKQDKIMTANEIYKKNAASVQNKSDHINLMWKALTEGVDVEYSNKPNGDGYGEGTIHVFKFPKGEKPNFQTISNDVYNQIEIQ